MTATCPVCEREQIEGLVCHACVTILERELGDVPAIVHELDVTLSRQSRIGSGGKAGPAHERTPAHLGAMQAADDLGNTLTTWCRDVDPSWRPERDKELVFRAKAQPYIGPFHDRCEHQTCERMRVFVTDPAPPLLRQVSLHLLGKIPTIRKHPAAAELHDEILDAVRTARRAVDRPADRIYLGQCMFVDGDVTCYEEIWARAGASDVVCKVCGITHDVIERRAWLLRKADDVLATVKEASSYLGEIGGIPVSQASIRGYLQRGRIAYHSGTMIRIGDLLTVLLDESERKSA